MFCSKCIQMNKFLLIGDNFVPEMHLRQPGFICVAGEPFTQNKTRIQKFKETGDLRYLPERSR